MKKLTALAAVVALFLSFSDVGFSQTSVDLETLRRDLEALKQGQTAIQKELGEIKNLMLQKELQAIKGILQAGQAQPQGSPPTQPQNVVLSVHGDPFRGDKNAKVTLVEFLDYECPFCARHVRETLPQLEADYIKTGKVKYVIREFPIESIHKQAFKAAEAARCAGEQEKYWDMHDQIYANQRAVGLKDLSDHAQALGLDLPKFQQCLDSGTYAAKVRRDIGDAQKAGVTGTPTFFLGLTESSGSEVKTVRKIVGAQTYGVFKEAIDSLLSSE